MRRLAKILTLCLAVGGLAALTAACGSTNIAVPAANKTLYRGAEIFKQRCSGCHSLSYAAAYGSAPNIRTAMAISGPNFNQRCERPVTRILYAIENGGFSGAYMPQNIVVGQDAVDVARFVATYAGRQAPQQSGVVPCQKRAIGTLPPVMDASSGTGSLAQAASNGGTPPNTANTSGTATQGSSMSSPGSQGQQSGTTTTSSASSPATGATSAKHRKRAKKRR
jgi:mono/diheme cytochrome c family protein